MFAIVEWTRYQDVAIVANGDGNPRLFLSRKEAEGYARENIASSWQVIYLFAAQS